MGSLIDAVWESPALASDASTVGEREVRILPDGCVDLIWLGDRLIVAGPDLVARVAAMHPGSASCGVRFRPGSARAVFGVPGEVLSGGGSIPAADVLGADEAGRLEAALVAAMPSARPQLLRRWAGRRLALGARRDPAVAAVSDLLSTDPGLRVTELAALVGYSDRQLRRRVQTEVGYGPKLLARILRLQHTLALARADRALSLADLAFAGGYVDQAHLGHECTALGGATPAALLRP